ncbi:MAG TPA: hypothetical protein VH186_15815 [Chloroflexia bacterium]|nr:hypothetical protein [Chloroflexia bacterium]
MAVAGLKVRITPDEIEDMIWLLQRLIETALETKFSYEEPVAHSCQHCQVENWWPEKQGYPQYDPESPLVHQEGCAVLIANEKIKQLKQLKALFEPSADLVAEAV